MGENDGNDISKLVILVVGVSAIAFFAYLIFKEKNNKQSTSQLSQLSNMSNIEQKLMQLNEKIGDFSKNQTQIKQLNSLPERKTVSLQSKPRMKQTRAEFFDMI